MPNLFIFYRRGGKMRVRGEDTPHAATRTDYHEAFFNRNVMLNFAIKSILIILVSLLLWKLLDFFLLLLFPDLLIFISELWANRSRKSASKWVDYIRNKYTKEEKQSKFSSEFIESANKLWLDLEETRDKYLQLKFKLVHSSNKERVNLTKDWQNFTKLCAEFAEDMAIGAGVNVGQDEWGVELKEIKKRIEDSLSREKSTK